MTGTFANLTQGATFTQGGVTYAINYASGASNDVLLTVESGLASPTLATRAGATAGGVVGTSMLSDTATVSGGNDPTGTVSFTLTAPDGTTSHVGGPVTVTGDGIYNDPGVTATEVGTYTWHASYSGDTNNNAATDTGTNESLTVVQASPTVATSASETAGGVVGTSMLSDTATVLGFNPTGTVTFELFDNSTGTGTPLFTATENLVNGVATSAGFTPAATGTYQWDATYSGDANNTSVTTPARSRSR